MAPTGPRTSNPEASANHSCVLIQKLESNRLLTRAICDKNQAGQITAKRALSRRAAAMDDYSDIDVIL